MAEIWDAVATCATEGSARHAQSLGGWVGSLARSPGSTASDVAMSSWALACAAAQPEFVGPASKPAAGGATGHQRELTWVRLPRTVVHGWGMPFNKTPAHLQ